MLKSLTLILPAFLLLTACSDDSGSSSGASTSTPAASPTVASTSTASTPAASPTVASTSTSEADRCAPGRYSFGTDADGKQHFDYTLQTGGVVRYNLTGGPVGRYTVSGSRISMNNVFPGNPTRLLELNVTQSAADCKYLVMRGTVNGAAVSSRRL